MKLEHRVRGMVMHVDGDEAFLARGHRLWRSTDRGQNWTRWSQLPVSTKTRIQSLTRLSCRLFRRGVHHLLPLDTETMVAVASGRVFAIDRKTGAATPGAAIVGSRPLCVCVADGAFFYGEYLSNPDRGPIRLHRSSDGGQSFETFLEFTGIRHIHGVFADPWDSTVIWVTTGDYDEESKILRIDLASRGIETVASGSQQARAVGMVFTETDIYFGSDTPLEQNYLHRIDRATMTNHTENEVCGSVFYGHGNGNRVYFGTVFEPSEVNLSRDIELWSSPGGGEWTREAIFKKDLLPPRYFQYGQLVFPSGQSGDGDFWLNPFAVRGDGVARRYRVG